MALRKKLETNPDSVGPRGTKRYESRAAEYLTDASRTRTLLEDAQKKAGRSGAFSGMWEDFLSLVRMIRAYADGTYRNIPWLTILTATAAVVYFVVPTDFIPDLLAGLGFLDDAAVLAWTLKAVQGSLQEFRAWEQSQSEKPVILDAQTQESANA